MAEMKRCKQCGVLKDVGAFRPYTYSKQKGTEGRFRICRQCENINSTYRRLLAEREKFKNEETGGYSFAQHQSNYWYSLVAEIEKIEGIYRLLEARGYSVPTTKRADGPVTLVAPKIDDYLDQLSNFYGVRGSEEATEDRPVATKPTAPALEPEEMDVPNDLKRWLEMSPEDFATAGLTPDYLQETVYESLKAKYRPQTGTDPTTFLPVYDDTYKSVLNQILRKFDDYEDYFAEQEGETDA